MNSSLEVLKKLYKPYRFTILGNVIILNTMQGDFVVKKKNDKNMQELFSYLESRSFYSFPPLVDASRSDVNVYKFISDVTMPKEQKALDLIEVISKLHNKTTYYKNVTEDDFKTIYDNIKSHILYLEKEYNTLYDKIKKEIYMSPSSYQWIRNSSKIFSALEFTSSELDVWFSMVKDQTKKRVCLIHNNLSLDHFLKKEEEYLISWENARVDSPIMDLVNFYKSTYLEVDISVLLTKYLEQVHLQDDEKKLFFILISLPLKIEWTDSEFKNCEQVRMSMDYLYITEKLVRPYYAIQDEQK